MQQRPANRTYSADRADTAHRLHIVGWPEPAPTKAPGWSPGFGSTDATGGYNISNWPDWTGTAWVQASKDGYAQQCVARTTIQGDTTLNIALAPLSNLPVEASRTTSATTGSRTISGVIYELTSQGRRPVENANVGWEHFLDFVVATTRSDAGGRYLLCGLPAGRIDGVFAVKDGYNASNATVDSGTDTLDIEIKPR